ncbi:hypothetical protein C7C46_21340 [Streptomyces tateyamensis]|uniref:Tetratricopeptide repeat protein n=1 Tax=Streptomyces tateyamensis TaxID=565073 RepID=A0A2V4N1Z0_9ACTN|nr:hypothetical protein [Streptomyces tateyamensis]PYC76737.1 hypothetical protein C7C46_21340 [Streptomyces tateyamensis]
MADSTGFPASDGGAAPVVEDAVPAEYRAPASVRAAARQEAVEPAAAPEEPGAEPVRVSVGGGLRGRILTVEGGYGSRRGWGRSGTGAAAPVLSTLLAAVAPQTLLAAEQVDAVHLPTAGDPQTVLAHLRSAARHPGPLLVHLGGHLVADKRGGGLQLTLRDKDGLAWAAIAAELHGRPADRDTLVIADLSAEAACWAQLPVLGEGLPLWAVVSPDPDQVGIFTRALVECLHGGRPGGGPVLSPEQLRGQVHSVLRPDALVLAGPGQDRPVFRNTARGAGQGRPAEPVVRQPASPVELVEPVVPAEPVVPVIPEQRGPVTLLKAGVAPTVRQVHPVDLRKAPQPAVTPAPTPGPTPTPEDYRAALAQIARTAEAGDHAAATELALTLEQQLLATHGAVAAPVLMVRQVRAHVARLAGDPAAAAELYYEVALVLLTTRGPADEETQRVATNAEACWRAIPDPVRALRTAPAILELRAQLPGPDHRKLRSAERYAQRLGAQAPA